MRQAYRILPVYTGDVSGVCSALYELGGMVVMHDPSGCNSTYNTHDEVRWYRQDSLIFLSGLCEPDAVMGNDDKFIQDVIRAAEAYNPAFIALCNSPIPYLTGTDFAGICAILQKETGIPSFYIPTNGMHDYVVGAGLALEKLAESLFEKSSADLSGSFSLNAPGGKPRINILGMTPLDFAAKGSCASLRQLLEEEGFAVQSVWAMDDSLESLRKAPAADANLVISAAGLRTAGYMKKRFGMPWVAGIPVGIMRERVMEALRSSIRTGLCARAYENNAASAEQPSVIVIGEPVAACSIAACCEYGGMTSCVLAATEESDSLIRAGDRICRGEEEIENALEALGSRCQKIIADPMYRYVCPEGPAFEAVPHLAFSGRIYRREFRDPFQDSFCK